MKKNLIWGVAIAILAFTSCSKSDISESLEKGTKLNFRVNSGKTTKAVTEVGSAALEATASLELYAFDRNGNAYQFPFYADNKVTLKFASSSWTPATEVYLLENADYPIELYSVYPAVTVSDLTFSHEIDYANSVNEGLDVLVGHGSIANSAPTETEISYQHALSQIIVTLKYTNGIAGTQARVNNCIVSSVACGTSTYTFGGDWGTSNLSQDVDYGSETFTSVEGTTPKVLDKFMAYPQTLSEIMFDWGIYDGNNELTGETGKVVDISSVTMTAGNRYYLDIVIDGALPKPTFKVKVTDWKDDTKKEIPAP